MSRSRRRSLIGRAHCCNFSSARFVHAVAASHQRIAEKLRGDTFRDTRAPPGADCDCVRIKWQGCVSAGNSLGGRNLTAGSLTYFIRNATLLPCLWNRTLGRCTGPPIIIHNASHVLKNIQMERASTLYTKSCGARPRSDNVFWRQRWDQRTLEPTFRTGEMLPMADDVDLVLLVNEWGLTSIGHGVTDNLFPIAMTAHILLGVALQAMAASAVGARVRTYVLDSNGYESEAMLATDNGSNRLAVPWHFIHGMQRTILGHELESADKIRPARYRRIGIGFWMGAQSVTVHFPALGLYQLRREAHAELLWREFAATARANLAVADASTADTSASASASAGDIAAAAAAAMHRGPRANRYGVWLRRRPGPHDGGAQRAWTASQYAALRAAACPASGTPAGSRGSLAVPTATTRAAAASAPSCWLVEQDMSGLTLQQQANAMRHARLAGSFEGSGFVNMLFMPPGGAVLIFDTAQRGLCGFVWGPLQYLHAHYIHALAHTRKLSNDHAKAVGHLLHLAWRDGTAAVCRHTRNDTNLTIVTRPHCGPPTEPNNTEPATRYDRTGGCRAITQHASRRVPARSQRPTTGATAYPEQPAAVRAAWEAASNDAQWGNPEPDQP